jgi:hypothetical protein
LTMDFSGLAVVAEEVIVHVGHGLEMTKLFSGGALEVVILGGILDDLALGIWLFTKDFRKCDSWRCRLLRGSSLLCFLLVALSLLLGAYTDQSPLLVAPSWNSPSSFAPVFKSAPGFSSSSSSPSSSCPSSAPSRRPLAAADLGGLTIAATVLADDPVDV